MGRPASITYEQVAAVAESLVAEGKRASWRAVRERIGSGTPYLVQEHLRTWELARPKPGAAALELSPAFLAALNAEVERQRAAALGNVQADLREQQERSVDLSNYAKSMESDRDQLQAQVETVTSERDRLEGELRAVRAEIERLKAEVAGASQAVETARIELAKVQLQAERLPGIEKELNELRRENRELLQRATIAETRLEERRSPKGEKKPSP